MLTHCDLLPVQIKAQLKCVRQYHLNGSKSSKFRALDIFWPKGGHGRAGSNRTSVVSGARELQVLIRFQSVEWAQNSLKQCLHLHSSG